MRGITRAGVPKLRGEESRDLPVRCQPGGTGPGAEPVGARGGGPGGTHGGAAADDGRAGFQLSHNVSRHVIVILKSQLAQAHVGTSAAVLRSNRSPPTRLHLMAELHAVHATHIKSYRLVDAFAATVLPGRSPGSRRIRRSPRSSPT